MSFLDPILDAFPGSTFLTDREAEDLEAFLMFPEEAQEWEAHNERVKQRRQRKSA